MQPEQEISRAIPAGLKPYFQEYDPADLNLEKDANLIIQRVLDFGTWDEVRWLFRLYGKERIRLFLRRYGERMLRPVAFQYWRKLLGIRKWRRSPFPIGRKELWNP
jgi:hypothetical protein